MGQDARCQRTERMRDRFHCPLGKFGVEPAIHPTPVKRVGQVLALEILDPRELLLPDVGPGAVRADPTQLPVADARHIHRHAQQIALQRRDMTGVLLRAHAKQQGAPDAALQPDGTLAATQPLVGHPIHARYAR
ncbi:hypothetical protein D3C77_611620 [compost metagenome]